jgi:phosphohistidine phosphatase SixA
MVGVGQHLLERQLRLFEPARAGHALDVQKLHVEKVPSSPSSRPEQTAAAMYAESISVLERCLPGWDPDRGSELRATCGCR